MTGVLTRCMAVPRRLEIATWPQVCEMARFFSLRRSTLELSRYGYASAECQIFSNNKRTYNMPFKNEEDKQTHNRLYKENNDAVLTVQRIIRLKHKCITQINMSKWGGCPAPLYQGEAWVGNQCWNVCVMSCDLWKHQLAELNLGKTPTMLECPFREIAVRVLRATHIRIGQRGKDSMPCSVYEHCRLFHCLGHYLLYILGALWSVGIYLELWFVGIILTEQVCAYVWGWWGCTTSSHLSETLWRGLFPRTIGSLRICRPASRRWRSPRVTVRSQRKFLRADFWVEGSTCVHRYRPKPR